MEHNEIQYNNEIQDYKTIQNDNIQSSLMRIQTLQQEYEAILQQYKEARENYATSLQSDSSIANFTALPGRTWWGTNGIIEGTATTQEECENMCSNADNCTGATFNPVKRYCRARTGDAGVSIGSNDDYALIPLQKAALIVMNELNDKLVDINRKITDELKKSSPHIQEQYEQQNLKQEQLNKTHQHLLKQKYNTEKLLQEYNSIEEDNINKTLYVNQQNISIKFWVIITCITLLVSLRLLYGVESPSISIIIWILIIIVVLILSYSLSYPAGFAMWTIVILSIMLIKIGQISNS